jgi:hypothetical protein
MQDRRDDICPNPNGGRRTARLSPLPPEEGEKSRALTPALSQTTGRGRNRAFRLVGQCLATALVLLCGGCGVERTIQIESDPPGALVTLNGNEVGRTPMRKTFVWYGTYDVQLRKEGYQTQSNHTKVWAPWWQLPPMDFFAELVPLPLEDKHYARYRMRPVPKRLDDPQQVVERAIDMRGKLRSSRYTRRDGEDVPKKPPQTAPATTRPSTMRPSPTQTSE